MICQNPLFVLYINRYCAAEPVFTRRPEAQKVGLNGVAEFHCGATGNPAPTIFWTKEVRGCGAVLCIVRSGAVVGIVRSAVLCM